MSGKKAAHKVLLGEAGQVEVDYTQRLTYLDWGPLRAYAAEKSNLGETSPCFALICDRSLMPRISRIESYMPLINCGLLPLVETGSAYWPPEQKECYIFVYEHNDALKRLSDDENGAALGLKPSIVMEAIISVLLRMLQKLDGASIAHGSLCLSNIYAHKEGDHVLDVLAGDMLALPCGYAQPDVYKTIPMMLADKTGYGRESTSDDIYAFGVCLALMMRTRDPMVGKKNKDILLSKMKEGTYATLIEKERLGTMFTELLKGVLHDDATQRWTLEDILLWHAGNKQTPKQFTKGKVAPRPFEFNGAKHEQINFLAKDVPLNPPEIGTLVDNGQLLHWLERSLADKEALERVQKAIGLIRGNLKTIDRYNVMAPIISVAMCPHYPVVYKGVSFFPSALCTLMIKNCIEEEDPNVLLEAIKYGVLSAWYLFQFHYTKDMTYQIKDIEKCVAELRNPRLGHGQERCIYTLSSHVPCLSPIFKDYYVEDSKKLTLTLEKLASDHKINFSQLMDRHIAAFLLERDNRMVEKWSYDLSSENKGDRTLALLNIYAHAQRHHKIKELKGLAALFLKNLEPCYRIYKDKDLIKGLKEKVEKYAKDGKLVEMRNIFTDSKLISRDRYNYLAASQEYRRLENERVELSRALKDKKNFSAAIGHDISAFVASILGIITVIVIVLNFYV